jgi:DNA mismatch repair protein MLH1
MSRIQKLSKDTIQRIAAGEVIQQPSSALKELLENSIDAGSTIISIDIKDGGMSLLQISDNGSGIHMNDFAILCHRFTTSKISQFSDLQSLSTFGFRGEALSSISLVSKLSVLSRKQGEPIAYKAEFIDGELLGSPQAIAHDRGTRIIIKDLFYNNIGRKRALSNFSQMLRACFDVVSKYALHYSLISFNLKAENFGFSSDGKGDRTRVLVSTVKGERLERDLIVVPDSKNEFCLFYGIITGWKAEIACKELVIFINGRLVESPQLKTMITQVYSNYLFKRVAYFVYLAIEISPNKVDVNVHPCKQFVTFTDEASVFSEISKKITNLLDQDIASNRATLKPLNPSTSDSISSSLPKVYPKSQVRTRAEVPLEWYLESKPITNLKESDEDLTSVSDLKREVFQGEAQDILDNFSFVGTLNKYFVLIQHRTDLYICEIQAILTCAIYQNILENFGKILSYEIRESTLNIEELLKIAMKDEMLYDPQTCPPAEILIESVLKLIERKKNMLEEYFGLVFNDGILMKIPRILDSLIVPDVNFLPEFILRLGVEVDWKKEKDCLGKVAELLGWFYSHVPDNWIVTESSFDYLYHYKNTLFPYLRGRVKADPRFISFNKGLTRVVSTEELYTIFERC